MLVTCPSCSMRYLIADEAIGAAGRRVRCKHCGHKWFQDLNREARPAKLSEINDDLDLGFMHGAAPEEDVSKDFQSVLRKQMVGDPIPPGVRPVPEDDPVLAQLGPRLKKNFSKEKLAGVASGIVFHAIILGLILALHGPLGRMFPSLNLLYNLVGLSPAAPGEGLALEGLKAQTADGVLTLSGKIINLRSEEVSIPPILATVSGHSGGEALSRVFILPPRDIAAPEEELSFTMAAPELPVEATSVSFAFSVVKPDMADVPKGLEPADHAPPPSQPPGHDSLEKTAPDHHDEPAGHDTAPPDEHAKDGHAP